MKSKFIAVIARLSLGAFVVLALSFNSYAASCNKRAEVHQQRAQNLKMQVQMGHIPTTEEEEFVVCMLEEKEDKAAFRERAQQLRNQQRAAQEREAAQQRQAAIEAARPATAADLQWHMAHCDAGIKYRSPQGTKEYQDYMQWCLQVWAAQPHSRCDGDNMPCGNKCFNPRADQRCVNGRLCGALAGAC